jgi:hypothetical protein
VSRVAAAPVATQSIQPAKGSAVLKRIKVDKPWTTHDGRLVLIGHSRRYGPDAPEFGDRPPRFGHKSFGLGFGAHGQAVFERGISIWTCLPISREQGDMAGASRSPILGPYCVSIFQSRQTIRYNATRLLTRPPGGITKTKQYFIFSCLRRPFSFRPFSHRRNCC